MSELATYLHEVLARFGPIRTRRMFGGHGVYRDDIMFALVMDEILYLKADAETVSLFDAEGLEPAEYEKGGKCIQLSYYRAPDEMMEDPDEAAVWARRAFDAALRARSGKR